MVETPKRNLAQKYAELLAGTEIGNEYLKNVAAGYATKIDSTKAKQEVEAAIRQQILDNPFKNATPIIEGVTDTMSPLKITGNMLWNNVKAHPWKTGLTAVNAAGNVGGLVDNDKLLGQIIGTAGGALLASKGLDLGPLSTANVAMLGGNLGMLFDKLRSKKEQKEQYVQQYM